MTYRLHRYYGNRHLHYITCSCYHRQAWLGSLRRRNQFLKVLEEVRQRYHFVVVGYMVMPEHFHLLISEPATGTPSTVMQVLKQRFAHQVLKQLRQRRRPVQTRLWTEKTEHVWQRRFYELQCMDRTQAHRKATLHASQSGGAGTGAGAGTAGAEQFPLVCVGRSWSLKDQ